MKELSDEFKDLENYFRISDYRDDTDYFLEDEYNELQEILRRCERAKRVEKARNESILGKIKEEDYKRIYDEEYDALKNAYMIRDKEMEKEKMNNKKDWEDYTDEEKSTLLNHWFYYYGGTFITLKEMEDFRKLASERQDDIFDHIVTSYIFKNTIQSNMLIACMRSNKVDGLFEVSLTEDKLDDEDVDFYRNVRRTISNELLNTFISPEPSVPLDIAVIIDDEPQKVKQKKKIK